jgi:hypothetical protein
MDLIATQATRRAFDLASRRPRLASRNQFVKRGGIAKLGPFLLAATIVVLPLQDHVPSLGGYSILYIMFGALSVYVLINRRTAIAKVSRHPVFLAAYALLFVGLVVEAVHDNSDYSELVRYGYMIAGAVLVASLCSERGALRAGMYGYLIASVWLSVFLFLTAYGALSGSEAVDFEEASRLRAAVFSDSSLRVNLNTMAFISSQGVIVALALMLTAKSALRRFLLMSVALFCFIASFVPMSRSGTVIAIISAGFVINKYKAHRLRAIVPAVVLGIGMLIFVPDSILSRLRYSTEAREGKIEGRALVYTAAWENLPEYIFVGVGTGNYFHEWANNHGLGDRGRVSGVHNSFFQVTVYWGLSGLLALLAVIWCCYRCLLRQNRDVAVSLFLYGIAVSLLLWMTATHNLYAKEFSLGIGLVVGARLGDRRRIRIPGKARPRAPIDAPSTMSMGGIGQAALKTSK